jgi:sortase A
MRSRLLLASAGLLWLLTGCVVPPVNPRSTIEPGESVYDSRPRNTTHPIVPPTPLLPEAGDGPSTEAVSTATLAPTMMPTAPPPLPSSTSTQPPVTHTPTPDASSAQAAPTRLIIPAIDLDVPVIEMGWSVIEKDGQLVSEWDVPEWRAAGWLKTSAPVGAIGNTVLEGHQDIDGRVFEHLEKLKEGDAIVVQTASFTRNYVIAFRTIVPEKDQPLEVRRENARWIGPSNDERLTLVTCWPRNDNTHRLILVALPAP